MSKCLVKLEAYNKIRIIRKQLNELVLSILLSLVTKRIKSQRLHLLCNTYGVIILNIFLFFLFNL